MKMEYKAARDLLLSYVNLMNTERIPLDRCFGRILAQDLIAQENVPAFDRSSYDGYAFRASDSREASKRTPVTLEILEEVAAGALPSQRVVRGSATKILTGAPIPEGADAVVMYEKVRFTEHTVTLSEPAAAGQNIIYAGEDVKKGEVLASKGAVIDAGLAGTLASQGIAFPQVFRRPKIGLISTGSEVMEPEAVLTDGKIRNSNRCILTSELLASGCEPVYMGIVGDRAEDISASICRALELCDGVLLTGGVSVGDYDLTPAAMELAGVKLLVRGVDLKPGMACAYGVREHKLVLGLSGNPASAMTNFCGVVLPVLKRMAGCRDFIPKEFPVVLLDDFDKGSRCTRLLRGMLTLEQGRAAMHLPKGQGNAVISSAIGCNLMAIVPAGSGKLKAGTVLQGFLARGGL